MSSVTASGTFRSLQPAVHANEALLRKKDPRRNAGRAFVRLMMRTRKRAGVRPYRQLDSQLDSCTAASRSIGEPTQSAPCSTNRHTAAGRGVADLLSELTLRGIFEHPLELPSRRLSGANAHVRDKTRTEDRPAILQAADCSYDCRLQEVAA